MATGKAGKARRAFGRWRNKGSTPASLAAVQVAEPARRTSSRRQTSLKTAAAAAVGGAGGALVGGLLVRSGVNVKTAAVGVTVAGAVGAMTLSGPAKVASYGAAAAGAGQLALGMLADLTAKQEARRLADADAAAAVVAPPAKRQGLPAYEGDDAFRDAYDAEAYDEAA